jgi:hypothetical protein
MPTERVFFVYHETKKTCSVGIIVKLINLPRDKYDMLCWSEVNMINLPWDEENMFLWNSGDFV